MTEEHPTILDDLLSKAVRLGGDALDVDYNAGYEDVCVMRGPVGFGIARFRSTTPEAAALRQELARIARKKRRVTIEGRQYVLLCRVRDSFGEDAFRIELRQA